MSGTESLYGTYLRIPLRFERGEGVWLIAEDGTRYLDFAAGIAVNSLGHAHPHLVAALKDQADKLWHTSNLYEVPGQSWLADRLTEATFADRAFFTNSGAEALECAIKTARRYHYVNGDEARIGIITIEGAFHGRTLATIAAGGHAKYLEGFGPKAPGFTQVPFCDLEAMKAAVDDETAAILVEPLQGEGGIRELPTQWLRDVRALCDEQGILLLLDEVQCGVGRTGKLFAHEWAGITPDVMAVAKGIGGGFPFGVCLATAEASKGMTPGTHGTTYGGNPLAMAVGNAVLDIVLEDGFLDHVREIGLIFAQGMAAVADQYPDVIDEVRGAGLMLGVRCKCPNGELLGAMRDQYLLGVPAGDNVVRLLLPLIVTADEARDGIVRLEAAATELSTHDG